MAVKNPTRSSSFLVLLLMIRTTASEKVEKSPQETNHHAIGFPNDQTILSDRSWLPSNADPETKGNILERLDYLEAKVKILLNNMPRIHKMDQKESQDRLEDDLPMKYHYEPANKKKEDAGEDEWRPKKASRLIPLSLLAGKKDEKESYNDPPTNCKDLNLIGYTLNGYFNVRNQQFGKMETIYCNFKQQDQKNGAIIEKRIGFLNLQSAAAGIYFQVERKSKLVGKGAKITFEVSKLNLGGAMNLKTGIFTAPTPGIYHFSFICSKGFSLEQIEVALHLNDSKEGIPEATSGTTFYSYSIQVTLKLKKGDRVHLVKETVGTLLEDEKHVLYFSGHLLQEEITLKNSTVVKA